MISIGSFQLNSPVFLAPMAGVTDAPFRDICQSYGAGLTTSEMLISDVTQWASRKSNQRLQDLDSSSESSSVPSSVQIVGFDPAMMAEAAVAAVERGADIVDINMGCPAKKVCKKAAGSALLRDEPLVSDILEAITVAVQPYKVPVTLKIRTGWDDENKNAETIAKIAEDHGIQALAIHGRTRAMRFNGQAEFDTIAKVKQAVTIPVIANGDITSVEKALSVLEYTGADGVMVGRGAQGRPWLIQQIADAINGGAISEPKLEEKRDVLLKHIKALHSFYGDFLGLRIARKHVGFYLQGLQFSRPVIKAFNAIEDEQQQVDFLTALFLDDAISH